MFVPFKDFPWFKDASIREISHVELPSAHHLYWPDLDIDLAVESLTHSEKFPRYTAGMSGVHRRPIPDPVIEALKRDVDRTLLRENLALTPQQRLEKLQAALDTRERLRMAFQPAPQWTWPRCGDDEIIGPSSIVPRILGISGPYWLFFYSFDCSEPMHVHVRRERNLTKFWLSPIALAWNRGFTPRELNEIRRIIVANEVRIIEAWHEHCDPDGSDDSAGGSH